MKLTKQEYDDLIRKHPNLMATAGKDKVDSKALDKLRVSLLDQALVQSMIMEDIFNPVPKPLKSPPTLKFTIPDQPVGSPRQTQCDKWMKRPCVVKYRDWCAKARASVPKRALLIDYREVHFVAYLEFPKSYSDKKTATLAGTPHAQKPDIDNLSKSLLDALFEQDRVIWKLSGEKRWDDGRGARMEVELI